MYLYNKYKYKRREKVSRVVKDPGTLVKEKKYGWGRLG